MNGNTTSDEKDENALKSNGDVDKNKPKVIGKKIMEFLKNLTPIRINLTPD